MDKKIDEELLDRPVDIRLKLNRQTAPDGETYYRANVQHRPTLDEQDLAWLHSSTAPTTSTRHPATPRSHLK